MNDNKDKVSERLVSCGEMVRLYLEQNGYTGLCENYGMCGCEIDDLMPCGGDYAMNCEAGHKTDGCDDKCGLGCNFHVIVGKN